MKFSLEWLKPRTKDLSKQEAYTLRPAPVRMNGGLAANAPLLRGIYTGENQDIALASYLSSGMINVPRGLVGIPSVTTGDPDLDDADTLLPNLKALLLDEFPIIVSTMLIYGTAWRWPRWDSETGRLVWEAIPDSSVTGVIIDFRTKEIAELFVDEQITLNQGESGEVILRRKRHFTRDIITDEVSGARNERLIMKNVFGTMPIPFGHDCLEGEWRGNSVFARVLRVFKSVHDIALKRDTILAEFEPKIVQTVKNVRQWIVNNTEGRGASGQTEFDPFGNKLFLNQEGESTSFLYLPGDATAQHTQAIADSQRRIMLGSGIPELLFGGLATGNYASTETDRLLAIEYIKSIRRELTRPAQLLIRDSLRILARAHFTNPPSVHIEWGSMSLLGELEKAQVLASYGGAISGLLSSGAVTPDGALFLTRTLYPDFPARTRDDFMAGLSEMMTEHTSKIGAPSYEEGDLGVGEGSGGDDLPFGM